MKTTVKLFVIAALLAATGCINVEQEIWLKTDGSGTARITYMIPENFFTNPSSKKPDVYGNFPMSVAELESMYKGKDGIVIRKAYSETDDNYRYFIADMDFEKVEQIGVPPVKFSYTTEVKEKLFKFTVKRDAAEAQKVRFQSMINKALDRNYLKITVHFQTKILKTDSEKSKGRTAVWDFPLSKVARSHETGLIGEARTGVAPSFFEKLIYSMGF
jgi:hypothetical protein